ncbi:MAG: virulence-associated E family protein [Gemella haemolysans]|uniref:virulence-associated E family protein n=1 Tax=Gemella haemolysans TaxID=1379 RepID=UPI00290FA463|nr:virulence-associated E family protein [Gemella haemolysans]MDU4714892.1 virulence-associated E family protein [Gemella haemolysans]
MIYKQIGTTTNRLTKVNHKLSPFETIAMTPVEIIEDNENKENYKGYKAVQFISGEFSEEEHKPIIRNNENLYYRDLIIIDIDEIELNSTQAIDLIKRELQGFKYLLYATLNHTEDKPRFRLVLEPTKKMNENEYKATIIHVMALLNMNFDEHSFTWSQPQGAPVTTKSNSTNYVFIKNLQGNKFPVQQLKQEYFQYSNSYENYSISHDEAIQIVKEYTEKESKNLEKRSNFISCLMVLCKAVTTGEIEYITGVECSRLLANIPNSSPKWEQENQKMFNEELKRSKGNVNHFKTKYSFKEKFSHKNKKAKKQDKKKGGTILIELTNSIKQIRNIKYNEMTNLIEIEKDGCFKTLENRDIQLLRLNLSEKKKTTFSTDDIKTSIYGISELNRYHPIKELIEAVQWDGVKRAETFFIDCLGVEDNELNKEVTRKWLLACITRLYEKGRKFDEMLILFGGQGIGKSTTLERLALDTFYTKVTGKLSNETILQTSKTWLVELDELSTLLRTPSEEFKAWLSSRKDTTRVPYEAQPLDFERGFVVLGTTNNKKILKDNTGNRRFWILDCNKDNIKTSIFSLTEQDILQVWAEVRTWYLKNESLLLSQTARKMMEEKTENYVIPIPFTDEIKNITNMKFPRNWKEIIHGKHKYRLHRYVTDMLNAGTSTEDISQDVLLDDITTQELFFLLTGNYRTYLNGLKATKDFSNVSNMLDNWKSSKAISRGEKRDLRGYKKIN